MPALWSALFRAYTLPSCVPMDSSVRATRISSIAMPRKSLAITTGEILGLRPLRALRCFFFIRAGRRQRHGSRNDLLDCRAEAGAAQRAQVLVA